MSEDYQAPSGAGLSPAAQAVLDAYDNSPFDDDIGDRVAIAAALRAAADTLVPKEVWDKYPAVYYRKKLLAIAAELESAQ